MKVLWLIDELQTSNGVPVASFLASYRYRVRFPAEGLEALGHQCMVSSFERVVPDSLLDVFRPDVIVIGKLLCGEKLEIYQGLRRLVFQTIEKAKASGITILVDVNDNHFDDDFNGEYWRRLVAVADQIVVGSEAMEREVKSWTNKPTHVVGDPLAFSKMTPSVFRGSNKSPKSSGLFNRLRKQGNGVDRLRCLWFGTLPNWESMAKLAERLPEIGQQQPLTLTVVTKPAIEVKQFARDFNAAHGPAVEIVIVPWSEESTQSALRECHVVLIPSEPEDPKKAVKTGNRLSDSLQAGRFVVASPLSAYMPYQQFTWLGDDLIQGIAWYLQHPEEALERIQKGQALVNERASLDAISRSWLSAMVEKPKPLLTTIRLNLGCGDKILEGYVNVDVAPSRAGKTPDVLCDLRDLSVFPDGHVDEILSVHVVEHFWRWEVKDILSEWLRVLKPGGRMILECPNLISACEALLNNPELASRPDQAGQRSMWVFYGDPAWKDPLMIHRWGYTPQSLAALMSEIGLVNVRQEPAQFKLREPRDMRLVGEKKHQ